MKYFSAVNDKNEDLGVWRVDDNYAHKIGIPNAEKSANAHFYIKEGQSLHDAMAEQLKTWFAQKKPISIKEMELKPGQYYKRIARPNDQHPNDKHGIYSKNNSNYNEQIASSRVQLISLISKLNLIFQTVHPTDDNLNAYGHEIRNILILACTEVEAQLKGILETNGYKKERYNTNDFIKVLPAMKLDEYYIKMPSYPSIKHSNPFKDWNSENPTQSLVWYDAYNKTKHDRENNFSNANLKNAIDAVCAVFILFFTQYGANEIRKWSSEITSFFQLEETPNWCVTETYIYPYDVAEDSPERSVSIEYNFDK